MRAAPRGTIKIRLAPEWSVKKTIKIERKKMYGTNSEEKLKAEYRKTENRSRKQ